MDARMSYPPAHRKERGREDSVSKLMSCSSSLLTGELAVQRRTYPINNSSHRHSHELEGPGDAMKKAGLGLLAFDVAAMWVIARTNGFVLSVALVMTLILANIILVIMFRRILPARVDSSTGQILILLQTASWIEFIPILGGAICVFIGICEFDWKPLVIGTVALAGGVLRIWAKARLRQEYRERR